MFVALRTPFKATQCGVWTLEWQVCFFVFLSKEERIAPLLTQHAGEVWTGWTLEFVPVQVRQVSKCYMVLCQASRWRCVYSRCATVLEKMDQHDPEHSSKMNFGHSQKEFLSEKMFAESYVYCH